MKYVRHIDVTALLLLALFLVWVSIPTSFFLDVRGTRYTDGTLTINRVARFGTVSARWWSEATDSSGRECQASGTSTYSNIRGPVVTFAIDERLAPCFAGPRPLFIEDKWQVMILGIIPLRPYRAEPQVLP